MSGPSAMEKDWDARFGKRLRALRRREGLTLHDMAAVLGISWQMCQRYETGRSRVPANRIAMLARVYRMRPDALLEGMDDQRSAAPQ